MIRRRRTALGFGLCLLLVSAVTGKSQRPRPAQPPSVAPTRQAAAVKTQTGDFDVLLKSRSLRILTPYSKTHYFIDKGVPRGIVYDAGVRLEETINKTLKTTPATKVHVVFVPTSRDALYQSLIDGRGDIIAAGVTITPSAKKLVDFTIPGRINVNQIVVTGPGHHDARRSGWETGGGPRQGPAVRRPERAERAIQERRQASDPHQDYTLVAGG
jgi:ABC-type amino acid transport substrate-binding protein